MENLLYGMQGSGSAAIEAALELARVPYRIVETASAPGASPSRVGRASAPRRPPSRAARDDRAHRVPSGDRAGVRAPLARENLKGKDKP
ncbi:MAG TPA: hypothetical protein VIG03_01170 [Steroidobacteraceae bacterium]